MSVFPDNLCIIMIYLRSVIQGLMNRAQKEEEKGWGFSPLIEDNYHCGHKNAICQCTIKRFLWQFGPVNMRPKGTYSK
jgi:hypothetical protein